MEKPLTEFHRHGSARDGRRGSCAACVLERKREYDRRTGFASQKKYRSSERGRASVRRSRLKQYGLTPEEYDAILSRQQGGCAVCGSTDRLHVDHDHGSGAVRGILCEWCNRGIGHFADDPERLRAAAAYLG